MPTLLEEDKIIPQKWMDGKTKRLIKTQRAIDFLVDYINDRQWESRDIPPKVKLKGPGDRVLVLRSGTGSGKSTVLPPFLYNSMLEKGQNKGIIVTQPTKATATDIPYQIVMYNDNIKLSENIGYQTSSLTLKPAKGILFSTVGILLQHLKIMEDEQFMKRYKYVIIDEVHARSMDVDMTLYYLKKLLERNYDNPDCPFVILMSATFDPKVFMEYFNCPKHNFLDIAGSTFPIEDNYLSFDASDYLQYVIDLVESIHVNNTDDFESEFRDVLIFVQGQAEIRKLLSAFNTLNREVFKKGIEFAKKHSEEQMSKYKKGGAEPPEQYYIAPIRVMSADIQKGGKEYKALFSPIETVTTEITDEEGKVLQTVPVKRRVLIGTNAIETGMTVDTLKYCIDTGFVKESSFNPNFSCTLLVDKNVTQANSRQRRGRVGRKAPGVFYAAYTKENLELMQELPYPDIVKEDISQFLLGVIISETETEEEHIDLEQRDDKSYQKNQFDQNWYNLRNEQPFQAFQLDFIQFPSNDSLSCSMEKLHTLGFIDHEYKPTLFGYYANKFRKMSLETIRMVLAGYQYGANILDLLTIAAFLPSRLVNKRFYSPRNPLNVSSEQSYYYYKLLFMDEFVEYLFIWEDFMQAVEQVGKGLKKSKPSMGYLDKWCKENYFSLDSLYAIAALRDEYINDMLNMGLNPYYNGLELPRGSYNLTTLLKRNLNEGMEEVRKIKQCLYEGYRCNLCIWNEGMKSYMYMNSPIAIESKLLKPSKDVDQARPQKIIVGQIMLRKSFTDSSKYEFTGDDVSVLDGYVIPDVDFVNY